MDTLHVALLPGMDGTGLLFEPFRAVLPDWVKPIIVRYPHDRRLPYSDLLEVVRGQLPEGEDFVMVAESFSGPLALMVAAQPPEGLRAVILCASFVKSPVGAGRLLRPFVRSALFRMVPTAWQARVMLGAMATPHLVDLVSRALEQPSDDVMTARAHAILGLDATEALRSCPVPLLYLRARSDRLVAARSAAYIAQLKPDAEIRELEGPHLLLQANPVDSWHAISEFLRRAGLRSL